MSQVKTKRIVPGTSVAVLPDRLSRVRGCDHAEEAGYSAARARLVLMKCGADAVKLHQ